jgi:hypothetical protein
VLPLKAGAEHTGRNQNGDVARSSICLYHISCLFRPIIRRIACHIAMGLSTASIGIQFDPGLNSVKIDKIRQSATPAMTSSPRPRAAICPEP